LVLKEDILKEIQEQGVLSDFEPAKKEVYSYPGIAHVDACQAIRYRRSRLLPCHAGPEIMLLSDQTQLYGELWLLVYTVDMMQKVRQAADDKVRELQAAQEAGGAAGKVEAVRFAFTAPVAIVMRCTGRAAAGCV
jgi:hypothetical protein